MGMSAEYADKSDGYMKEQWKKIPSFETYQVSNLGRVRNIDGKILKLVLNGTRQNNQYLAVSLQKIGDEVWQKRKKLMKIHRLVLMAFDRLPEDEEFGCHKNDNRFDNRVENLYWGNRTTNAHDAIRNGVFNFAHPGFGENHHSFKHNDETIKKIRNEYTGKRGEQTALAKKYSIPQQYISSIVNNKIRVGGIR